MLNYFNQQTNEFSLPRNNLFASGCCGRSVNFLPHLESRLVSSRLFIYCIIQNICYKVMFIWIVSSDFSSYFKLSENIIISSNLQQQHWRPDLTLKNCNLPFILFLKALTNNNFLLKLLNESKLRDHILYLLINKTCKIISNYNYKNKTFRNCADYQKTVKLYIWVKSKHCKLLAVKLLLQIHYSFSHLFRKIIFLKCTFR